MIRPNTYTMASLMIDLVAIGVYGWWTGAWRSTFGFRADPPPQDQRAVAKA